MGVRVNYTTRMFYFRFVVIYLGIRDAKQPVLATSKGVLISGDVIASTSPCGSNCTFIVSFHGPLAKCDTTNFNESLPVVPTEGLIQALPKYSGGWNVANIDRSPVNSGDPHPGWITTKNGSSRELCDGKYPVPFYCTRLVNQPNTFFVSQHTILFDELSFSRAGVTLPRSTKKTSCTLHRGRYTLRTTYLDGRRTFNLSTSRDETLDALWAVDRDKLTGVNQVVPVSMTSSFQVMNLFALFDSLVQALRGEYYIGRMKLDGVGGGTVDIDMTTIGGLLRKLAYRSPSANRTNTGQAPIKLSSRTLSSTEPVTTSVPKDSPSGIPWT
jgi:hypothetical protein